MADAATTETPDTGGDFDAAMTAALADDAADSGEAAPVETEAPEADTAELDADGKPVEKVEAEADEKDAKPKEEKKDEPKAEDETPDAKKLRQGFAALARDRAKLRDREAAASATLEKAKGFQSKAELLDTVLQRMDTDPVGLLRERGGEALVDKFLDAVVASEKSPAEVEVAKLRAEREQEKAEAKQREQLQTVATWKAGIAKHVQDAGEKYDLVNSLGQHEAVVEVITQYYQKHNGAVLDVETAAQAVEDTLSAGLAKSKKFGAREPVKTTQPSKGTPAPARKGPTLSSVHSSELPPSEDDLPLDPTERFNRVMAGIGAA